MILVSLLNQSRIILIGLVYKSFIFSLKCIMLCQSNVCYRHQKIRLRMRWDWWLIIKIMLKIRSFLVNFLMKYD